MKQETKYTPEAEALADAILRPSGSNLKNYTMAKTREAILSAAQKGIDDARADLLEALKNAREWISTGEVDGVEFDEGMMLDAIDAALAKTKGAA